MAPITRPNRYASKPFAVMCCFVLVLSVFTLDTQGQNILPDDVATSSALTPTQDEQLRQFVGIWGPMLSHDEHERRKRARQSILAPLTTDNVSVRFRIKYARLLLPHLQSAQMDDDISSNISALRIAGELAAPSTIDMLLFAAKNDDAGIRFTACAAMGRSLRAISRSSPAIASRDVDSFITGLIDAVSDLDPAVADAAVRSLAEASDIPVSFTAEKNHALNGLLDACSDRARALDSNASTREISVLIRALGTAHAAIVGSGTSDKQNKKAAALAGDALSLANAALALDAADDPAHAEAFEDLIKTAENVIVFSANSIDPNIRINLRLPTALRQGPAAFNRAVQRAIGPGGVLTSSPFNLPAKRFER